MEGIWKCIISTTLLMGAGKHSTLMWLFACTGDTWSHKNHTEWSPAQRVQLYIYIYMCIHYIFIVYIYCMYIYIYTCNAYVHLCTNTYSISFLPQFVQPELLGATEPSSITPRFWAAFILAKSRVESGKTGTAASCTCQKSRLLWFNFVCIYNIFWYIHIQIIYYKHTYNQSWLHDLSPSTSVFNEITTISSQNPLYQFKRNNWHYHIPHGSLLHVLQQ